MKRKPIDYSNLVLSLTSKLARMTGKAMEKPLEKLGVSLQEFRISGLLIGGDPVNQKDLARMLSVKPATLSVAINKLEEKGVLERKVSLEDKRVNYLSLCDGLDFSEVGQVLQTTESMLFKDVDPADIEVTRQTLIKMISNLEKRTGGAA